MPPASPESLGLQCEDRAWSLLQPDTRERLEVVSQWLEAELRRTDRFDSKINHNTETARCSAPQWHLTSQCKSRS